MGKLFFDWNVDENVMHLIFYDSICETCMYTATFIGIRLAGEINNPARLFLDFLCEIFHRNRARNIKTTPIPWTYIPLLVLTLLSKYKTKRTPNCTAREDKCDTIGCVCDGNNDTRSYTYVSSQWKREFWIIPRWNSGDPTDLLSCVLLFVLLSEKNEEKTRRSRAKRKKGGTEKTNAFTPSVRDS